VRRRRLRAYLPGIRWVRVRILHESKDGAHMPARLMQLFGGRNWSVSIIRHGPPQQD
jgi:hypothetical protein